MAQHIGPSGSSSTVVTSAAAPSFTLRLRASEEEEGAGGQRAAAAEPSPKARVQWREGTVDNEFLGRKSSKRASLSRV
jgi:hypothetical protein